MLPRRAHDEMASLLLKQGARLWFIRTNQVGGWWRVYFAHKIRSKEAKLANF